MTPRWTPGAPAEAGKQVARCVILPDDAGAGEALARALRAAGTEVVTVTGGNAFTETPGGFTIDPASPADHAALAERLATSAGVTVVDLRLLDRPEDGDGRDTLPPVARLLAAWGEAGADSARVLLVTRAGQAVSAGERPDPGQAAAATLPMVANQEYLNLDCATVDVAPGADAAEVAGALAAEVRHPSGDVFVAYREGSRLIRAYTPAEPASGPDGTPIRPGGTYLVTGGLGDVGLLLAGHLARKGAGRLILLSRGGVPDDEGHPRRVAVDALRELGVEVSTPRVDVTDAAAVRALLAGESRLDGVVHAAAVTTPDTFSPLRDLEGDGVARHFDAKVTGALTLERALAETDHAPDFCVLFSSTSALLGGITFGSYAAANAALTAIAHRQHEGPAPWTAASWDTWSVTLDRIEGGFGAAMAAHSMTADEALAAFDRLRAAGHPHVVVAAGGLDDRLPRAVPTLPGRPQRGPRPEAPTGFRGPSCPSPTRRRPRSPSATSPGSGRRCSASSRSAPVTTSSTWAATPWWRCRCWRW
ncbi:SDR family NAD(P)-dependent oxidoreductase [Nonomuraea recticatena]|uniref:SDR family NAD(P)-dependent oxidoreductase n=1 Tax=Nonomuraea recticatena TaxID=46178 RepID=UPI003613A7CC